MASLESWQRRRALYKSRYRERKSTSWSFGHIAAALLTLLVMLIGLALYAAHHFRFLNFTSLTRGLQHWVAGRSRLVF